MSTPATATGRRVMKLYVYSGLIIVALMLLVGLTMRAGQAGWVPGLDFEWFYSLLTLHAAGMIVALALCGMGGLWYLMRRQTELSAGLALLAWGVVMLGVLGVIVSTLFGHFAGLYTFLYPLPFKGSWSNTATGIFLLSMMMVNLGWMAWCMQMTGSTFRAFGGLRGALAWDFIWHRKRFQAAGRQPPPPEAFPALMVGFDGMVAGVAATLLCGTLLVHWVDPGVALDPLWAKNLVYFFAHTLANLIIYMLAALIYVSLPYVTRRSYHTSAVLVVGWWTSMTLTLTNYFHHLYMDFAQPTILSYVGELSSYMSALPVTAVTVFSALMLVWRSRTRWTLGAIFMYSGLIGWIVGGIGAEIDASVPFNIHLHNTLWVPAHFHTYLLGGCLMFVAGWVFLLLESRTRIATPKSLRWLIGLLVYGGMTVFLLGFYFAGADGVPRRYATEPAPGPAIAQVATIGAAVMLVGFILAFVEGLRLRRHAEADRALWLEEEAAHEP